MNTIIRLKNVTKTFSNHERTFTALHDIDLSIEKGAYVAIVGRSGSGKSTLLNMITGIDHPSQGEVEVNGTKLHTLSESRLAKWRGANIGIVFQFFQLVPTLTIIENLLLAMEFVNAIPKEKRKRRALSLLNDVGIAAQAHKLPSALSGGEQQRAAIARALANNPDILVADEPAGNLDSTTAKVIYDLFGELVKAGKTVIVVTHDQVLLEGYHKIVTLEDGTINKNIKHSIAAQ